MTVRYDFDEVQVDQLAFDPDNPRLPPDVDGSDDEDVVAFMLSDSGMTELMASIARQGYFPGDPLLIAPKEESNSDDPPELDPDESYIVVEGNRRLAALKMLTREVTPPKRRKAVEALADEADNQNLSSVPAVVFARRDDVLEYLGFRHITGIKQWDPLEKARFLGQLRERAAERGEEPTNTELARAIGSTGPYVGRLLAALSLLEIISRSKKLKAAGVVVDDVPFSLLVAALNHNPIVEHLLELDRADDPGLRGLSRPGLLRLGQWLFVKDEGGDTALGDSRNLKLLDDIVTSDKAMDALDEGMDIDDAALLAHGPADIVLSAISEAAAPLEIANEQADELAEASKTLVAAADKLEDLVITLAQRVRESADG